MHLVNGASAIHAFDGDQKIARTSDLQATFKDQVDQQEGVWLCGVAQRFLDRTRGLVAWNGVARAVDIDQEGSKNVDRWCRQSCAHQLPQTGHSLDL